MTAPGTLDNFPQSTGADATAAAIIANRDRLGLTWDLKPATALSTDSSTNRVKIQVDGDTVGISGSSMVGPVMSGERVYALLIPPAGVFVVGRATSGDARLVAWGQRTAAKTGVTGTEVGALLLSTICQGSTAYRISCATLGVSSSLNEAAAVDVRIRYSISAADATTSSTLGAFFRVQTFSGSGTGYCNLNFPLFIGSASNVSFLLTIQRITGAGTMSLANSIGDGPIMLIEQIGPDLQQGGTDV